MSNYGRHPYATSAIRPSHRKTPNWPIKTTPPRCDECRRELPACTCKEETTNVE